MLSVLKQMRRVGLAVVALGSVAASGTVFAQNTASGTSISNTATVNYAVNSVNQAAVSASASFLVDTVINLNVTGGFTYDVTPGALAQVATYTVTNTSNIISNFTLAASDQAAPANDFNMGNFVVHVDDGDNVYEAVEDTATSITGLARGASITVFVTGDVPGTATNNQDAPVRLTATAIDPGTSVAWVNDASADDPAVVQIVVANAAPLCGRHVPHPDGDAGRDQVESGDHRQPGTAERQSEGHPGCDGGIHHHHRQHRFAACDAADAQRCDAGGDHLPRG